MRAFLAVLIACIVAPFAIADTVYWTVVPDDGTASDVVNAANFAASMKASVGVTFSGRTDSQVEQSWPNQERFLVRFEGRTAVITAADEELADVARRYLEEQGFAVSQDAADEPEEEPEEEPETEDAGREAPEEPAIIYTDYVVEAPDERAADRPMDSEPDDAAVEQPPGFLRRLWGWFARVFS